MTTLIVDVFLLLGIYAAFEHGELVIAGILIVALFLVNIALDDTKE